MEKQQEKQQVCKNKLVIRIAGVKRIDKCGMNGRGTVDEENGCA